MRQLKIDLSKLEMAFDNSSETISYYLDSETGEVIAISDEERSWLESLSESYADDASQEVDWEAAFEEEQIPDRERERLQQADRVEDGAGSRYIEVPSEGPHEGYGDMEAFIDTIRNPRLQERLERAIAGRGAFRYFKDVLLDHPAERERWFKFKDERLRERIVEWLEAQGITPI